MKPKVGWMSLSFYPTSVLNAYQECLLCPCAQPLPHLLSRLPVGAVASQLLTRLPCVWPHWKAIARICFLQGGASCSSPLLHLNTQMFGFAADAHWMSYRTVAPNGVPKRHLRAFRDGFAGHNGTCY